MAMALPKQEGEKILQLVCDNAIDEIGGKKKNIGIVKSGMEFSNVIATIPFHFFFFFFKK